MFTFYCSVYVQTLNRKQSHLNLALIPVGCFVAMQTEDEDMPSINGRKYPPIHVIYEDTSEIWVNVSCFSKKLVSCKQFSFAFTKKNIMNWCMYSAKNKICQIGATSQENLSLVTED